MTTERNKRIILSLRMESNHAPPAFRADVLTTVLERSVDHSFRSVLCSKGNTSNITRRIPDHSDIQQLTSRNPIPRILMISDDFLSDAILFPIGSDGIRQSDYSSWVNKWNVFIVFEILVRFQLIYHYIIY